MADCGWVDIYLSGISSQYRYYSSSDNAPMLRPRMDDDAPGRAGRRN